MFYIRDRKKLIWTPASASPCLSLALRFWMVMVCTPGTAERWVYRTLPFRHGRSGPGRGARAHAARAESADRVQRSCRLAFPGRAPWSRPSLIFLAAVRTIAIRLGSSSIALTTVAVASMGLIGMTLRPAVAYAIASSTSRPARVLGKYSYGFLRVAPGIWINAWIQFLVLISHKWTHSLAIAGLVELPLAFADQLPGRQAELRPV